MTQLRLATAVILLAAAATLADPPAPARPSKPDPISEYEAHTRQGFKVMVSKRLAVGAPMLRCLDERLAELIRVVPPAHLSLLRGVTFWVEAGEVSEPSAKPEDVAAF